MTLVSAELVETIHVPEFEVLCMSCSYLATLGHWKCIEFEDWKWKSLSM